MLAIRIIPCLLLKDGSLVKTVKFKNPTYIGDPINTIRIFNELEVDELFFLDICASRNNNKIDYEILKDIANECFMPLGYGGGIKSLEQAKKIFNIGFEKIILNTSAILNRELLLELVQYFGSQAIVVSIDVRKNILGKYYVYSHSGENKTTLDPYKWVKELEKIGIGEIFLTSINQEGTWKGFDIPLIKLISNVINIPLIAHGGAGNIDHIKEAVFKGHSSAVALGSMVVYQKKDMGVLINFPDEIRV